MYRKLTATMFGTALGLSTLAMIPGTAQASAETLEIGETASFSKFDVTLNEMDYHDEFVAKADVTVCAKDIPEGETIRVSWGPWSLTDVRGKTRDAGQYEGSPGENAYPWDGTDGPPEDAVQTTERYLSDGECANGKIGFSDPVADNQAMPDHIAYENSLGDEVKWNLNH